MYRKRKKRRRPERRRAIRRTLWILGTPTSNKRARGLRAEEKALQALGYYRKKKTEFSGQRIIIGIETHLHYSLEDLAGIDISVQFESPEGRETLGIQVQNWEGRKERKEFREKGICLVVIRHQDDGQRARKIVSEAISQWFNNK